MTSSDFEYTQAADALRGRKLEHIITGCKSDFIERRDETGIKEKKYKNRRE